VRRSWNGDTNKHIRSPRFVTASKFPSNKPCTVQWSVSEPFVHVHTLEYCWLLHSPPS
jgi:hypothetical protein